MQVKYDKATVRIHGKIDKKKIEEATIKFMIEVLKGENQNGNNNTSRIIKEK